MSAMMKHKKRIIKNSLRVLKLLKKKYQRKINVNFNPDIEKDKVKINDGMYVFKNKEVMLNEFIVNNDDETICEQYIIYKFDCDHTSKLSKKIKYLINELHNLEKYNKGNENA